MTVTTRNPTPRSPLATRSLASRGQASHGIRAAEHPRWAAALCVAPRTNSTAAIGPSSRLASGALRRSRCSSGPVHGTPALRRSREIVHGLLGLLLAGALTLAAALPASGQSRADSAAVLLGTAETMERHGSEELALALLQYLASRFPDTESGRIAASRAESNRIAHGAGGGETELKVWGTTYDEYDVPYIHRYRVDRTCERQEM